MVARERSSGPEVLLLERSRASRFAPGAFVFPGGTVDADDGSPFWRDRIPPTEEPAACVAALRELFEETGLLPVTPAEHAADSLAGDRKRLLRDDVLFSRIAADHGLDFSRASLTYFSRWITPRRLARRYDTRFFLLALEGDRRGSRFTLTGEHESGRWAAPGDALAKFRAGDLPMLFPTWKTLERLADVPSLHAALRGLESPVEPILAKLDMRGDRIRPLMPGDPGYDDAY